MVKVLGLGFGLASDLEGRRIEGLSGAQSITADLWSRLEGLMSGHQRELDESAIIEEMQGAILRRVSWAHVKRGSVRTLTINSLTSEHGVYWSHEVELHIPPGAPLRVLGRNSTTSFLARLFDGYEVKDPDFVARAPFKPWHVQGEHDEKMTRLISWLDDRRRRYPVVLVSDRQGGPCVSPEALAERLAPLALIVHVQGSTHRLSHHDKHQLTCYSGAVRVCWPDYQQRWGGEPDGKDLWLSEHIKNKSPELLIEELYARVAEAYVYMDQTPKLITEARAKLRAQSERALKAKLRAQLDASMKSPRVNSEGGGASEFAREVMAYAEGLEVELEEEKRKRHHLERKCVALEMQFQRAGAGLSPLERVERFEARTFENVAAVVEYVVESECLPHLIVLDSALKSAKKSPYQHPERVQRLLADMNAVAGEWLSALESGETFTFKRAFEAHGHTYKSDVSAVSLGRWRSEYEFVYKGEKRVFGEHFTLGAGNANTCMSVHFVQDKEEGRLVVGHVGKHLKNTLS